MQELSKSVANWLTLRPTKLHPGGPEQSVLKFLGDGEITQLASLGQEIAFAAFWSTASDSGAGAGAPESFHDLVLSVRTAPSSSIMKLLPKQNI
uniref:Uncharacterized protein n=1 Tax=Oryza nivara TaxID=4536 RepID=A0A0E0GB54_ORYNI